MTLTNKDNSPFSDFSLWTLVVMAGVLFFHGKKYNALCRNLSIFAHHEAAHLHSHRPKVFLRIG